MLLVGLFLVLKMKTCQARSIKCWYDGVRVMSPFVKFYTITFGFFTKYIIDSSVDHVLFKLSNIHREINALLVNYVNNKKLSNSYRESSALLVKGVFSKKCTWKVE